MYLTRKSIVLDLTDLAAYRVAEKDGKVVLANAGNSTNVFKIAASQFVRYLIHSKIPQPFAHESLTLVLQQMV